MRKEAKMIKKVQEKALNVDDSSAIWLCEALGIDKKEDRKKKEEEQKKKDEKKQEEEEKELPVKKIEPKILRTPLFSLRRVHPCS